MKPIDPNSYSNPRGWRSVYSEYQRLRQMAKRLGEPTNKWQLFAPETIKERADGSWQLRYTMLGRVTTAYIGYNVRTAVSGLQHIYSTWPRYEAIETLDGEPTKKVASVTDGVFVITIWMEWKEILSKVKSGEISERDLKNPKYFKLHKWLLKQRAGILPMSMQDYLSSH